MRRRGDFGHRLHACILLGLHEPGQTLLATAFKAVGPGTRFPKACAQKSNTSTRGELSCSVQNLVPGLSAARPRDDHGLAVKSGEGMFAVCRDAEVFTLDHGTKVGVSFSMLGVKPIFLKKGGHKKTPPVGEVSKYPELDSNQHARRHSRLKTARLPISPPG